MSKEQDRAICQGWNLVPSLFAEGEEQKRGKGIEFNTKTPGHKGHKVQKVFDLFRVGTRTAACSVSTELSPKRPL